ncbi:MAG: hypothetical protein QM756_05815 [Polyangiaceae bacterium]
MNLLESVEVRWFFAPSRPLVPALTQWFAAVPLEADDRLDHYYFDARRPDLNAKDRSAGSAGAKLEFKYRVGSLGPTYFAPGVQGELERWAKLSLTLAAGSNETIEAFRDSVSVKKQRRLRKFSYDAGSPFEVSIADRPTVGCGFELTCIEAVRGGQRIEAVTVGLESFGAPDSRLAALQATARVVFAERPLLQLASEDSASYSTWLIRSFAA